MLDRIKKFLAPPVFDDEEQSRTARFLNVVLLTLLAMTVIGTAVTILLEPSEYPINLTLGVVLVVAFLVLRALVLRGYLHLVGGLLSTVLWLVFTFLIWSSNGLHNPAVTGYLLVIILAALLAGRYAVIPAVFASVVSAIGAMYGERIGLIPVMDARTSGSLDLFTLITTLSLAAILLDFAVRSINQGFALARDRAQAYAEASRELRMIRAALEERVVERTRALEHRSEFLRVAAEVGRGAMAIHDVGELLPYLADTIRGRFALRYVLLYLLDERGDVAMLRAASAEADRLLPALGSRVEVGGRDPVGYTARFGEPRFTEPPGGVPKAYVPMVIGRRVIGVLEMEGRLRQEDLPVLQVLADLSATAIENARLLTEARASLEVTRWAYEEASQQAWAEMLRARAGVGYACDYLGDVRPVQPEERISRHPEARSAMRDGEVVRADDFTVFVPLRVRGRSLGVLRLRKPEEAGRWSADDIALMGTMVEQLGVALESARLYQSTQRMAARERAVGEIAGKLRASLNPDEILKVMVRELGRALRAEQAMVEITGPIAAEEEETATLSPEGED